MRCDVVGLRIASLTMIVAMSSWSSLPSAVRIWLPSSASARTMATGHRCRSDAGASSLKESSPEANGIASMTSIAPA